jgi:hypothetical protein
MANYKTLKLTGDLMWVYNNKENDMSKAYQLDICNLSDAAAKTLKEIGGRVLNKADKPEKGNYIVAKSNKPIETVDKTGAVVDKIVGNGSKGEVTVLAYPYDNKFGKGIKWVAVKITVTQLAELPKMEDDEEIIL